MDYSFLIFPYIILNVLMPTFLLAMGFMEKRWHLIFCYLVPVGIIFYIIIDSIPMLIVGIKEELKKLK